MKEDKTIDSMLLVLDILQAAVLAGVNINDAMSRMSDTLKQRHLDGQTATQEDLLAVFNDGDDVVRNVRSKVEAALADPSTPAIGS